MNEAPGAETFRPHIGEAITVAGEHQLTLVSLEERKMTHSEATGAFTVILRGAPAPIVPEGVHRLTFKDGAGFDLYLMPIHTPSRQHQDYQIAFN